LTLPWAPAAARGGHVATAERHLREQIAEHDKRIGGFIEALERGMEPNVVGAPLAKPGEAKEKVEIEL
jgi:hypothetical protein